MKKLSRIAILIALLVLAVSPVKAFALTLSPLRFEVAADPGETVTKEIKLVNESKTSQFYYISFSNFEAQGDSGSPTFIEPRDGLGTWITTSEASVNLAPGQQKTVTFTVSVPKDAEPGGYFAAIFFGTTAPNTQSGVTIGTKTGALLLLSVRGDVEEAAGLVDFQLHNNKHIYRMLPVGFQYRFSNQGGDRVKPVGSIVVRSILGWRVEKVNANPFDGNVLPKTTRKFTPEWSKSDSVESRDQEYARNERYSFTKNVKAEWKNFAVGIFRARAILHYGSTDQMVKSKAVYFVVFPWELLLVCFVIVVPLWLILRALVRSYNRRIIRNAQARFTSGQ